MATLHYYTSQCNCYGRSITRIFLIPVLQVSFGQDSWGYYSCVYYTFWVGGGVFCSIGCCHLKFTVNVINLALYNISTVMHISLVAYRNHNFQVQTFPAPCQYLLPNPRYCFLKNYLSGSSCLKVTKMLRGSGKLFAFKLQRYCYLEIWRYSRCGYTIEYCGNYGKIVICNW